MNDNTKALFLDNCLLRDETDTVIFKRLLEDMTQPMSAWLSTEAIGKLLNTILPDDRVDPEIKQLVLDAATARAAAAVAVKVESDGDVPTSSDSDIASIGIGGDDDDDETCKKPPAKRLKSASPESSIIASAPASRGKTGREDQRAKRSAARALSSKTPAAASMPKEVGGYNIPASSVTENDVLRGRAAKSHPGNVQFLDFVSSKRERYADAIDKFDLRDKIAAREEVIKLVESKGGRFLEKHPSNKVYREMTGGSVSTRVRKALENASLEKKTCKHLGCGNQMQLRGFCRRHAREHGLNEET